MPDLYLLDRRRARRDHAAPRDSCRGLSDSGNPGMLGQTDAGGGSAGDRAVPTAIPRNLIRGESIVLRSGKNCVGQHNEALTARHKFQLDCEGAPQRNPERGLDA